MMDEALPWVANAWTKSELTRTGLEMGHEMEPEESPVARRGE